MYLLVQFPQQTEVTFYTALNVYSLQQRRNVLARTESINIIQIIFLGSSTSKWIACEFHSDLHLIFTPFFRHRKTPKATMAATIRTAT
jgi:hypothetical protein